MNTQLTAPIKRSKKPKVKPILTNALAIIRNPFPWPTPAA